MDVGRRKANGPMGAAHSPATVSAPTREQSPPVLDALLEEVRECRACEAHLPLGARPVVQAGRGARLVVVGQAPGRSVHESGVPWDDPSGDRLRGWLGLRREEFYDPDLVALVPMGFCYPGSGPGGDRPPRPECAPRWHDRLLPLLTDCRLRIVVGRHAQLRYHPAGRAGLTEVVRSWRRLPASLLVLPHPSGRNNRWLAANPWFADELLPVVRRRVARAVGRRP